MILAAAGIFGSVRAVAQNIEFVANARQWPGEVRYKSTLPGGSVFLTNTGFVYSYYSDADLTRVHDLRHHSEPRDDMFSAEMIRGHAYRVSMQGANPRSLNAPSKKRANYYNYFLGNDSSKWAGGVPAYDRVAYRGVYPEIDLNVYSEGASMKYDFIIGAGADPAAVKLKFDGVKPALTAKGDLEIKTSVNTVLEKAPYAYQMQGDKKQQVACRYALQGSTLSFEFPAGYDRSRPLIIDPVLVFATYSGSTYQAFGWSATGDANGNLYAGGESFGTGWPITFGAFQVPFGGIRDAGVSKYSSNGAALIYSTYYGGDSADLPNTMVINPSGELVMAGFTNSPDLPVTSGCYDNSYNGHNDLYIVHFSANGTSLIGATFLGGTGMDGGGAMLVGTGANRGEVLTDSNNNIYIAFATTSTDFPTTPGAYQSVRKGNSDAIVAKLNSSCSNLLFSTYVGGDAEDAALTMRRSKGGRIIIGGATNSTDFPGVTGHWQTSNAGGTDGFIAVLDSGGTTVHTATYLGTTQLDDVSKLQMDDSGFIYATGPSAGGNFPFTPGVYRDSAAKNYIIKLDSMLNTRILSTTVGRHDVQVATSAFLVDICGNIYLVGYNAGVGNMPLTSDALQRTTGGFWMCVLDADLQSLRYASYFGNVSDHIDGGSSRLDPNGVMYHSICTGQNTLPTNSTVYSPTKRSGGYDNAAWKLAFAMPSMAARMDVGSRDTICLPDPVVFRNTSIGARKYLWDFGDGTTSTRHTPAPKVYARPGVYTVKLYAFNSPTCNPIDSTYRVISMFDRDTVRLIPGPTTICGNADSVRIPVKPEWEITVSPDTAALFKTIGGTEILLFPRTPADYIITAKRFGPCINPQRDSIKIRVIRDTTVVSHINVMSDTVLCGHQDSATYVLKHKLTRMTIVPSTHVRVYPDSQTIRFYPPVSTVYRMIAAKSSLCETVYDTFSFHVQREAVGARFELTPKIADQLDPNFTLFNRSSNANAYEWYLNDAYWSGQKSPTFTTTDTGTYCFTLIARNDYCEDTTEDCARLIETHIFMPNAFTPNGDGRNDVLGPITKNTTVLEFSIYNRYGQRVFVSYDHTKAWDGTYGGKLCDMGTYFYKLRYQVLDREPQLMKGDIALIR